MYYRTRPYDPALGLMLNRNPWVYIHKNYSLYDAMNQDPINYVEPFSHADKADMTKPDENGRMPIPKLFLQIIYVEKYWKECPIIIDIDGVPDYAGEIEFRVDGAECKGHVERDRHYDGQWTPTSETKDTEGNTLLSGYTNYNFGVTSGGGLVPGVNSTTLARKVDYETWIYKERLWWRTIKTRVIGQCKIKCCDTSTEKDDWKWVLMRTNWFNTIEKKWRIERGTGDWVPGSKTGWLPGAAPELPKKGQAPVYLRK